MPAILIRIVLAAILLGLAPASQACAHAQLVTSQPAPNAVLEAPPDAVVLDFNEPVGVLAMTLVDSAGSKTELVAPTGTGAAVSVPLPGGMAEGTYVLNWRVASEDGHIVPGSLLFSIGEVSGSGAAEPPIDRAVAAVAWIAKVAVYLGLFFGVGGAIFRLVTPVPEAARRLAGIAVSLGLFASALSLAAQGLDALGLPLAALLGPSTWAGGLASSYGRTILALGAAFLLAGLALWLPRGRASTVLGVLAWLVGACSLSLSGHASAAHPQWLTRLAVFVHVAGILFWVGALVPLALLLRDRSAASHRALSLFSRWIPCAVVPLVLSGVTLAVVQLGAPGPQWLTAYGAVLGTKLALLCLLFALAVWNRLRLTVPSLAGQPQACRRLQLSLRAEIVLVLLILAVVAGWRFTVPPRALSVAPSLPPIALHVMDATTMAMVTIAPGEAGPVQMGLVVTDMDGLPVEAEGVSVLLTEPGLGIGPLKHAAALDEGIWYVRDGAIVPVAGIWQVEVDVRVDRFKLLKLTGEVDIP